MKNKFSFELSLSVLNHLGRNLYRSFITVLGEAISNSWDADARNVEIYVNREKNSFFVKDDGIGMTGLDFQEKFLKVGYSKRKTGQTESLENKRPYIGRKGIGKLALLSCAKRITVISKTDGMTSYIGGVIDNSELDKAIIDNLKPSQCPLGDYKIETFERYTEGHKRGTIIYFEDLHDGIKNSLDLLKKVLALYFRFSLIDNTFNIFVDGEKITHECLSELATQTEFLWTINGYMDPYIKDVKGRSDPGLSEVRELKVDLGIKGFVASVKKPRNLNIFSLEERVGIDLFVNGRLREKDILKRIPTNRLAESYIYGQIHFDELDDKGADRFTSSREGVVADDPKYLDFLGVLRKEIALPIVEEWDRWRIKNREDGDSENDHISKKERSSRSLFNAVSKEFSLDRDSQNKKKVDAWVNSLVDDAQYNLTSYAECFVSENLVRLYCREKQTPLSEPSVKNEISKWRNTEVRGKRRGNLSISIRQADSDFYYLDMEHLVGLAETNTDGYPDNLLTDEKQFTPIRNALMHTSLLTNEAKRKLSTVYDNIKARVINLLA